MILAVSDQKMVDSSFGDCKMDDQIVPSWNWSKWRPCGRQEEINQLHRFYMSREENDLVLITGATGIGKTTLSQSLQCRVQEDSGFLIRGTFSFSAEPYEAFKAAFTSLVWQLQDRLDFAQLRQELQQAIASSGTEGFLISDSLPILSTIMQDADSVSSDGNGVFDGLDGQRRQSRISPTDRQQRFVNAMAKILEAIGSILPLVIVLDNVMWADLGSLQLLESLCVNKNMSNVLIVATCRGDEVGYKAPLATRLRSMEDRGVRLLEIVLKPLKVEETLEIIETLQANLSQEISWRLAQNIQECTGGVPRLILELLNIVESEGLGTKLLHMHVEYSDLVNIKVFQISSSCQEILQVIACLGGRAVHESALMDLLPGKEGTEIRSDLQTAKEKGFLVAGKQLGECTFFHSSIQEAIYALIPSHVKCHIHYAIAQGLCSWLSMDQLEDNIFLVVDQYLHGRTCVPLEERSRIAELCLWATRKAAFSAAFSSAEVYVRNGIEFLEERVRWRDHYDLTLELMNFAIELEFCNGNHEGVDQLHKEILANARTILDKIPSYTTHISSLGARRNHIDEAIVESLDVLECLGEKLPRRLLLPRTVAGLVKTKNILKRTSDERILSLPRLSDARVQAAQNIFHLLFVYVFLQKSELVPLVSMRIIDLTIQYGLSPISAASVGIFGLVLMASDDFQEGYRCGQLALKLMDAFKCKELTARTHATVYGFLSCYRNPIRDAIQHLRDAYSLNMVTGDVEMAITSGSISAGHSLQAGVPLPQLIPRLRGLIDVCVLQNQHWNLRILKMSGQFALNMSGPAESRKPIELSGELMTEDIVLKKILKEKHSIQLSWLQFLKYMMAVYLVDLPSALEVEPLSVPLRKTLKSHGVYTRCHQIFHEGILSCFLFSATNQKMKRRRKVLLGRAKECLRSLQPFVAACPANYKNKSILLEAEIQSLSGETSSAEILLKYEESARLSKMEGFLHEHALCLEKAGYHVLQVNVGAKTTADVRPYFRRAIVAYENYGAMVKVQRLRKVLIRLEEVVQLKAFGSSDVTSSLSSASIPQIA